MSLLINAKSGTNAWYLYIGSVLAYALIFWFWQVQAVPIALYFTGVAIWAVAVLPVALWYRNGFQGLPMFELICVAYGLSYGPPIYLVPNQIAPMGQSVVLSSELMLKAAWSALLGLIMLILGYNLLGFNFRYGGLPQLDMPLSAERRIYLVGLLLLIGLLGRFLGPYATERFRAILHLLECQFQVGIIILAYQIFSNARAGLGLKILLVMSVCSWAILGIVGGTLEGVAVPITLVFMVRWHVRRRFPWALAAVIPGIFLILTPLKLEYRARVWEGSEGRGGVISMLKVWWSVAEDSLAGQRLGQEQHDSISEVAARLDLLHKFAYVESQTPNEVPYFKGNSYSYLIYTFIPRVLWPNKPVASAATDLVDFAYGLRSEQNTTTNIGIGQIAEAFANFGWYGILGVMILQGLFLRSVNQVLNGPQSDGGRAIYVAIAVLFLNGVGTSAVVLFGSVIQLSLASAVLMRPFALCFSTASLEARLSRQARRNAKVELRSRRERGVAERPAVAPSSEKPPV